jgi:hypothetical protein
MGWTAWLIAAVSLASLYGFGMVLYRLYLNAMALKREVDLAKSLIAQAQTFDELPIAAAKPSSSNDLSKLLVNRRAFVRKREKKAEERQHRLVQRIRDIEIDKRKA